MRIFPFDFAAAAAAADDDDDNDNNDDDFKTWVKQKSELIGGHVHASIITVSQEKT